ncbi:MAG TPA: prepilin-type N-terminal cleavage/methylation domain-containing protein [Actinomycetota bacterium]
MLQAIRKRMEDDKGFTLIELMVVVLIIAILIAIAIPTFLGLRQRAQDRAAQSDLRNGLTAAKAWYTDGDTYAGFNETEGEAIEPSLDWVAGGVASTTANLAVSVGVGTTNSADDTVGLSRMSASGTCFHISDVSTNPGAGTFRNSGGGCTGAAAVGMTSSDGSW